RRIELCVCKCLKQRKEGKTPLLLCPMEKATASPKVGIFRQQPHMHDVTGEGSARFEISHQLGHLFTASLGCHCVHCRAGTVVDIASPNTDHRITRFGKALPEEIANLSVIQEDQPRTPSANIVSRSRRSLDFGECSSEQASFGQLFPWLFCA